MDTVLICDTEPVAAEGLRRLLESTERLRVVASETSLAEARDAARQLQPGVLVVEKAFGIKAVIDWLEDLRGAQASPAAIVWSVSFSEAEAVRFVQAGAAGVVRKTAPLNSLLECIRTVALGGAWIEEDPRREAARPAVVAHPALTGRESQVMELVERGWKNREIATALGIRPGTVKIHLKHISEKTGIRGRYGLALSGLREKGLLAGLPEQALQGQGSTGFAAHGWPSRGSGSDGRP